MTPSLLTEQSSKQTTVVVVVLLASGRMMPRQLLEKRPFGIRQTGGELHRHLHLLIPAGHGVPQLGNALVGQGQHATGLGARWNLQSCVAIDGFDLDPVSQDRLQITDVHGRQDVESIPAQPWM